MSTATGWIRCTPKRLCPICERDHFCTISADGTAVWCTQTESSIPKKNGLGDAWIHMLKDPLPPVPPPKVRSKSDDGEQDAMWRPIVLAMRRCSYVKLVALAERLGVSCESLDRLGVGYGELAGTWCWTFPERNPRRQYMGITRRLVEPQGSVNKKTAPGSRRGLTFADDWDAAPGPVFVVEGGSDTAAGLTLGLCVVGRPSNMGGVDMLAELLRPVDRLVLVVGERDRKPHGRCRGCKTCWPGNHGAKVTARRLRKLLGDRVRTRLMPEDAKDMRSWLNAQDVDPADVAACHLLGRRLAEAMS